MAGTKAARVHSLSEARRYFENALSMLEGTQLDDDHQQKYIDLKMLKMVSGISMSIHHQQKYIDLS